jgi:hypothetical protein
MRNYLCLFVWRQQRMVEMVAGDRGILRVLCGELGRQKICGNWRAVATELGYFLMEIENHYAGLVARVGDVARGVDVLFWGVIDRDVVIEPSEGGFTC